LPGIDCPEIKDRPLEIVQKENMSDQEQEQETAPIENGEAAPAKRPRGRPKKAEDPDAKVEAKDDNVPKRGRGRPRKYPPSEKKVPSGRPRGRPKGSGKVKDPGDVPLASEKAKNSRKRGRPVKIPRADSS